MGTWMNNDGLYIKYGTDEGVIGKGGALAEGSAGQHVIDVNITLSTLTTTAAIVEDNVIVPKGYVITRVQLITTTAATSGGSATLDVGLMRLDRSTNIDDDGLIVAAALSTFNSVGETLDLVFGSTGAGALVGTVTDATYPSYITASYNTAAFTAGVVKVRVFLQKM